MKKIAFTLAEVLITLSVIGIVAVLTIPRTIDNYKKKMYTVQFKKAHAQFTEVFRRMPVFEGVSKISQTELYRAGDDKDKIFSALKKYLKVTPYNKKITYLPLIGNEMLAELDCSTQACFRLVDGGIFTLSPSTATFEKIVVNLDINGEKAPNRLGRDYFQFGIMDDASVYGAGDANYPCDGWECLSIIVVAWSNACNVLSTDEEYLKRAVLRSNPNMTSDDYDAEWSALSDAEKQSIINENQEDITNMKTIASSGLGCTGRIIEKGKMDY